MWCPKCGSEYRPGFTVCAECKIDLVEKMPTQLLNDEDDEDEISAYAADMLTSEELQEAMNNPEAAEEMLQMAKQAKAATTIRPGAYQNSTERANENKSSAWMLMILGAVGMAFVVLCVLGIIPISFGSYLIYGVMGALFVLFFIAGIVSMKNAKFFEIKAQTENNLKETILNWVSENLKAEDVDARVKADSETPEVLYIMRCAYIAAAINFQFVNMDQQFVDRIIEEDIYDMLFGD